MVLRTGSSSAAVALAWWLAVLVAAGGVSCGRPHVAAAVSQGPCTPRQVHVSLTGNPTELRVSWKTLGASCPSTVVAGPAAALASTPWNPSLLRTHRGEAQSYSSRDTCAPPARTYRYGAAFLHSAVLTGLAPGKPHFYQIDGGEVVEFTAGVGAGPRHSFTFLVFGDLGESVHRAAKSPGAARTVELLEAEVGDGAELIMHIGDLAYANGVEEIWDAFMESIEPFARHIPYMVGAGNHEYDYEWDFSSSGGGNKAVQADASGEEDPYQPDWGNFGNDSGGECGVQISKRFLMPDVSEFGYYPGAAASLAAAAAAAAAATGNSSSASGGGGRSRGVAAAWVRNPTLGPDAAAFLRAQRQQQQEQQQQQQQQPRRGALEQQEQQEQQKLFAGAGAGGAPGLTVASAAAVGAADAAAAVGRHWGAPNPPFWYSFSHGSVHFVVLSTEHNLQADSKQYAWLVADLAAVDRCRTPWVVLSMHRPMYVVYPHKSNRVVGDHLRDQLEEVLEQYEVDLVVSGHVHSYARTCNVWQEHCVPPDQGGITHITVGCAGHKLTDITHDQEEWLEYATVRHGYGRVTVTGADSLLFEMVGHDGDVYDSVKLHNSRAALRGCEDAMYDAPPSLDTAAGADADAGAAAAGGADAAA